MAEKILIIGAGACGLYAARTLIAHGLDVTIIEARGRIGGRICTVRQNFSFPVELGAEFVHGKQPLTQSLLSKAGERMIPMQGTWNQVTNGQLEKMQRFDHEWNMMHASLKKLEHDIDFATFLNQTFNDPKYDNFKEGVLSFVEGYDAADSTKVSTFSLRDEWENQDDEEQFHIVGGYGSILAFMENELRRSGGEIVLNSIVDEIIWSKGYVKVSCENGSVFHGEKLLITVPLGVLQKGTIRFTPPLPFGNSVFHKIGFGGVIKFLFEFKTPFWDEARQGKFKNLGFLVSDAEVPTWWTQPQDKTTLLTGWLGGPSANESDHHIETLQAKAIDSLQYLFSCDKNDIIESLQTWHIADWVTDPFSFGAYTYATTETRKAREVLSLPVEETIYFAGEALYEGPAPGTVEAALSSGKRVADQCRFN